MVDPLPTGQLRPAGEVYAVNLRRERRLASTDVVIELDNADELFAADPRGLLAGAGRIDGGMDELVDRFLAQKQIEVFGSEVAQAKATLAQQQAMLHQAGHRDTVLP